MITINNCKHPFISDMNYIGFNCTETFNVYSDVYSKCKNGNV